MDVVIQGRAVKLLTTIFDRKEQNVSIVKTVPQKTELLPSAVNSPLPRSSPEKQGLDSSLLHDFIDELYYNGNVFPHCVMVIKNGHVVCECSYAPYSLETMHVTHSLCKSITGIAVCMLIDEGKISLDDSIGKLFESYSSPLNILRPVKTTVRQLLTMSSGVVFNELGVVADNEWIKSFLESNIRSSTNEFNYNSMNTFMLSALVKEVTGQTLEEYLTPRLFEPLGIKQWLWEKSSDGNCKGGWGLYMHLEDLAKIGCLLLQKGVWNGKRLISESMVREMTSINISTPKSAGDYDYGYQIWVGRVGTEAENSFLFNGMLGQNIVCFPEKNLVVACFAGNNSMFQQNDFFSIVNRTFGKSFRPKTSLPEDHEARKRLRAAEMNFSSDRHLPAGRKNFAGKLFSFFGGKARKEKESTVPEEWLYLDGKTFSFLREYTASVSLVPLFIQTIQNNFSDGLTDIVFEFTKDEPRLTFVEGTVSHVIEPGIGHYKNGKIEFHGEVFAISSKAVFTQDEDDRPVMKLDIAFTETANVRKIKIFLCDEKIFLKFTETPGIDFILEGIEATIGDIRSNKIIDMIFARADTDYLIYKMKTVFEPEFTGRERKELHK